METAANYPVKYLKQAFYILEYQNHDVFRRFVARVDMPTEDIERVLNKHNYIHNPEFRAKIDKKIARIKELCGAEIKV
jgi:hypothetical protein